MLIDNLQNIDRPLEDCPTFECLVSHEKIYGDVKALAMNAGILQRLANPGASDTLIVPDERLQDHMIQWLKSEFSNGASIVIGGKNPGFDLDMFLTSNYIELREGSLWIGDHRIHHRKVDPTFCFFDPLYDLEPPSMNECLQRAGIQKITAHRALDDCKNVALLVRAELTRRKLWHNSKDS